MESLTESIRKKLIEENVKERLIQFGLTGDEIDKMSVRNAFRYIKYHYKSNPHSNRSILFLGFSEEEKSSLGQIASYSYLRILSRASSDCTFICASKSADINKVAKAIELGAKLITQNDLYSYFNEKEYNLTNCELIFNPSVPVEFRIPKLLSAFNYEMTYGYKLNFYLMTCTCSEFIRKEKKEFLIGDIRRLCRHLTNEYKWHFYLGGGLSDFNRFIIENGHSLNKYFKKVYLPNLKNPVIINYQTFDDWWNVFILNDKGEYSQYGYDTDEKRFSYGEKPFGHVKELRIELNKIASEIRPPKAVKSIESKKYKNDTYDDSAWSIAFLILIIILCVGYFRC